MNAAAQILDTIAEDLARGDRTDAELLDLFVRVRDEGAFASVVRRHGPMVLGVCRRVLRNAADADDAFQAAFLVLARKAATLDNQRLLAHWLYGVAYNTARKLRRSNARRARREQQLAGTAELLAPVSEPTDERLAALDDELSRLPERYRAVIVLCDLEGLTRKEAAKLLACPEGTVAGRLARARELLGSRLAARDAASAVGLLAVLAEGSARAVSPTVVAGVVRAVGVDGLAQAAARGFISPRVVDTTEGVLRSMFATKVRTVAASVLCCGLALACAVGGIHLANAQPEPAPTNDPMRAPLNPLALLGLGGAPTPAPAATAPKSPTVIPLRVLDADTAARALAKRFDKGATITPLPDDKALLVYADATTTKGIEAVLIALGEPAPKHATAFKLDKKADCTETAKTLSEAFGKTRITVVAVPEDHVLLVYASEADTQTVQKLLAKVLVAEPVQKTITLKNRKAEDVALSIWTLLERRVEVVAMQARNELVLIGLPDAVDLAIKLAKELDRPADQLPRADPRLTDGPLFRDPFGPGVDPHMVLPVEKVFTFNFKNAKWADVLDWYAKESDLALVAGAKPTGTFTFTSPPRKTFTLAEITDLINESLMQQKFILIRRKTTFFLHPADEKLDPTMVPRVTLDELGKRGRTELVQVVIPVPAGSAKELAAAVKALLGPFGTVVPVTTKDGLLVQDVAGNVLKIGEMLYDLSAPKPEK